MPNLKISREKSYSGYRSIVKPGNSCLEFIDFGLLNLKEKEIWQGVTDNHEAVFLLQKGSCEIKVDSKGKKIETFSLGPRDDLFKDKAHLLYIPPDVSFIISCKDNELSGAFIKAPASHEGRAFYVSPDMMQMKDVGKDNWSRRVCRATLPECGSKKLLVGETFNPPGNWSSYPPHKHDTFLPDKEVPLEEIYYYRFNPKGGFALQRIYETPDKANPLNEVMVVEDGDTVILPRGYHPLVAAPGYDLYYLWILAGENPLFGHWSEDNAHEWLLGK